MKQLVLLAVLVLSLAACQKGIPEPWPKTYAEYAAMNEQQKLELKAHCMKYQDESKGIHPPSCWLTRPKAIRAQNLERFYQRKLEEWEAFKNAQ